MIYSNQEHCLVATYDDPSTAGQAIQTLQKVGIDMRRFSLIGGDAHADDRALGFYTKAGRIEVWSTNGPDWSSQWGILSGGAFLFLPPIGALIVMGPVAAVLMSALEGSIVGGASAAFVAALTGIGVPKSAVPRYEAEVKDGKFLVVSYGVAEAVDQARVLLQGTGAARVVVHRPLYQGSSRVQLGNYLTRSSILNLLSDAETARVCTAETVLCLDDGDEYLDLEELGRGVLSTPLDLTPVGQTLPRLAVGIGTWDNVLRRLAALPEMSFGVYSMPLRGARVRTEFREA